MNPKIKEALSNVKTGDVEMYFDEMSKIIEKNSGTHENKLIIADCYNVPAPVALGNYTYFKLSDANCDIISLDKSYITAKMHYDMSFTTAEAISATNDDIQLFIGFKSGIHIIDEYRIYVNGQLRTQQTKALHENALVSMFKCNEELRNRPHMYTRWDDAHAYSQNVCGVYVPIANLLAGTTDNKNASFSIDFEINMQIDDLLPFSGMTMFPNFLTGDLEIQIKQTIMGNLVYCVVDPNVVRKYRVDSGLIDAGSSVAASTIKDYVYTHEFTQVGDPINFPSLSKSQGVAATLTCKSGTLIEGKSYVYGFRIKDSVKQTMIAKFTEKPIIIPAQTSNWNTLSQVPTSTGVRANLTTAFSNCTNLCFTFPRTSNEITVSKNPHLDILQCRVNNQIWPEKPLESTSAGFKELMITNAGLDSLFSAPKSFTHSLQDDEYTYASNGSVSARKMTSRDGTDFVFNIALERLSGAGTYFDGLDSNGSNLQVNLDGINSASGNNPYVYPVSGGSVNSNCVNMYQISDAFWIIGKGVCEFTGERSVAGLTE